MNKVILIGNLTKDPEVITTSNGFPLCRFSIAVNRNYKNANGENEVDFFDIKAWRGLAENCGKFLSKGKKVAVSGSIEIRNYEDKDGIKKKAVDIAADDVQFLSPRESGFNDNQDGGYQPSKNKSGPVAELKPVESDELPF